MKITVAGNEQRMLLLAVYDNLGKGASGAADPAEESGEGDRR